MAKAAQHITMDYEFKYHSYFPDGDGGDEVLQFVVHKLEGICALSRLLDFHTKLAGPFKIRAQQRMWMTQCHIYVQSSAGRDDPQEAN